MSAVNIAVVVSGGPQELLQATPLIRTLRQAHPGARLVLLAPCSAMGLQNGLPEVSEALFPHCLDQPPKPPGWFRLWVILRRQRLDAVYLCSRRPFVRLAAYLNGIPVRYGVGGGTTSGMLSDGHKRPNDPNLATEFLDLAALSGAGQLVEDPAYQPTKKSSDAVAKQIHALDSVGRIRGPLIALGMTGRETWPAERFAHLSNQLCERHGAEIVLFGQGPEDPQVEAAKMDMANPPIDRSGDNWDQVAAWLARCELCISSEPAMLQLAAAVGTSTVGLFGRQSARVAAPTGEAHHCVQGVSRTLQEIRVDDVLACVEMP